MAETRPTPADPEESAKRLRHILVPFFDAADEKAQVDPRSRVYTIVGRVGLMGKYKIREVIVLNPDAKRVEYITSLVADVLGWRKTKTYIEPALGVRENVSQSGNVVAYYRGHYGIEARYSDRSKKIHTFLLDDSGGGMVSCLALTLFPEGGNLLHVPGYVKDPLMVKVGDILKSCAVLLMAPLLMLIGVFLEIANPSDPKSKERRQIGWGDAAMVWIPYTLIALGILRAFFPVEVCTVGPQAVALHAKYWPWQACAGPEVRNVHSVPAASITAVQAGISDMDPCSPHELGVSNQPFRPRANVKPSLPLFDVDAPIEVGVAEL